LFSETSELSPIAYAKVLCDWIADSIDDNLTDKRENDDVVGWEIKRKGEKGLGGR
jgi:hypothetical protein